MRRYELQRRTKFCVASTLPSQWQGRSSAGELRNIQEGTQSASLFEIPAGYTKMDIGNMMQQHSQQH